MAADPVSIARNAAVRAGIWGRIKDGTATTTQRGDALLQIVDAARTQARAMGKQLASGSLRPADYFARMTALLGPRYEAAGYLLMGSQTSQALLQPQIDRQFQFLYRFFQGLLDGSVARDKRLITRSELYARAIWAVGMNAARDQALKDGADQQERRVLGNCAVHCGDCPPLAALGWQPIGTLPEIGDTECMAFCHCSFEYRASPGRRQPVVKPPRRLKPLPQPRKPPVVLPPAQRLQEPPREAATAPVLPPTPGVGTIAARLAAHTEGDRQVERIVGEIGSATRIPRRDLREANWRREQLEQELMSTTEPARRRELIRLRDQAAHEAAKAKETLDQAVRSQDKTLHEILGVTDPVTWEHVATTTKQAILGLRDAARAWVEPLVSGQGMTGKAKLIWRGTTSGRAFYDATKRSLHLEDGADVGTAVHEWGHGIENQLKGVQKAAQEFLAHRAGNEKPTRLSDLMAGAFDANEFGVKDEFDRYFPGLRAYYVGKRYEYGDTEIVSMGLEALYHDPVGFAKADPEYCKFILGILTGHLR